MGERFSKGRKNKSFIHHLHADQQHSFEERLLEWYLCALEVQVPYIAVDFGHTP
jgi:hypothetical protein